MSDPGPQVYARIREIFDAVRSRHGAERERLLEELCAESEVLRKEVELLLRSDEAAQQSAHPFSDAAIGSARSELEQMLERGPHSAEGSRTSAAAPDAHVINPAHASDHVGATIGRCQITRRIASGGMGTVYEAEQEVPRRRVAIKMVHAQRNSDALADRLRRESEILARLQHPGIAQIFSAGMTDIGEGAQPFFIMEFIDGVPLTKHAQVHNLGDRGRLDLLATICDAVHFAHGKGVIHRDLKPDNILVSAAGAPKILDFGIARIAEDTAKQVTTLTRQGQILGTLAYMAPEMMDRGTCAATSASDVYSLGVIGFELLAGRLPHDILDMPVTLALRTLSQHDPPKLGSMHARHRGDVQTIIAKALEREPQRRYQSAASLAADIRRYLAHEPITARPAGVIYRSSKFVRRNRALVAGTLATMLVLIAGIAVAANLAHREQSERRRADASLLEARHSEARVVSSIMAAMVRLLDAGRSWEAFDHHQSVPESSRGWGWRLMSMSLPDVRPEFAKPAYGVEPFTEFAAWRFFDDERLMVFDSERGCVRIASIRYPPDERELFYDLGLVNIGSATATGLAVGWTEDTVFVLDLIEGSVRDSWPASAGGTDGSVSDDGRVVALGTSKTESRVWVDGRLRWTVDCSFALPDDLMHCIVSPDGKTVFANRHVAVDLFDVESGEIHRLTPRPPLEHISATPVQDGWISHEWSGLGGQQYRTQLQHGAELNSIVPAVRTVGQGIQVFAPRDGRFAVVNTRGGLCIVSTTSDESPRVSPLQDSAGAIDAASRYVVRGRVSPSGNRLLVLTYVRPPWIIDLDPRKLSADYDPRCTTYRGHSRLLYHVAVSNDGTMIASLSPIENVVHVWNAATLETIATTPRRVIDFVSQDALMAFSADDSALVFTSPIEGRDDVAVVKWSLLDGTREHIWPEEPVTSANHAPLLDLFIAEVDPAPRARLSQKVQMRDTEALAIWRDYRTDFDWPNEEVEHAGSRWRTLPQPGRQPKHDVMALAIHPIKPVVATVGPFTVSPGAPSPTGMLTLRHAMSGAMIREIELPHFPRCVAYAPDGSLLAIGTNEGHLMIFESEFYTVRVDFKAHRSFIYSLAWMPDGHRLVSVSGDATVRIWDDRPLKDRGAVEPHP